MWSDEIALWTGRYRKVPTRPHASHRYVSALVPLALVPAVLDDGPGCLVGRVVEEVAQRTAVSVDPAGQVAQLA